MQSSRRLQLEQATLMDCAAMPITFDSALIAWCEWPLEQVVVDGSWSSMVCAEGRMAHSLTTFIVLDSYQFICNQFTAKSGPFARRFHECCS